MYTQTVKVKKRAFIHEISNPHGAFSKMLYMFDVKINDVVSSDQEILLVLSCKSQDALEIVVFQLVEE